MALKPLRVGARPWAHVTALGAGVTVAGHAVDYHALATTPRIWDEPDLDVAETSLSQYVRARSAGDDSVTGLPIFVMRGFRQRCILVPESSPLESAADLAGRRIGLTGWPDSGNTWTRELLTREGVDLGGIEWFLGPLTPDAPQFDRSGGVELAGNVHELEAGDGLTHALERGHLDAIMTPFMPPGFYTRSGLRTLHRDSQSAEEAYYRERGYLPGMHLIAVRTALLDRQPALAQGLVDAFEEAKQHNARLRDKLQDAFPWHDREQARTARTFGTDWLPYGWPGDQPMVADFQQALVTQDLLPAPVPDHELFPHQVAPSTSKEYVA
ncbi:ABC transporter substrate-binding protein [Ornithinimicrobium cavernae]|uniref:ABC transporter substrate-binding protein n=1 Tax=Ornithinimicrobium cavernae TaxID=2666047 RepID=UPI000D6895E2|nr:hypothetical protein [Ornithinimicrobium cavernae]